jgi:hypothetical protein
MTSLPQKQLKCLYSELKSGNIYAFAPRKTLSPYAPFYLLLSKEEKINWTRFGFLEMPSGKLGNLIVAKSDIWSDLYLISSCGDQK